MSNLPKFSYSKLNTFQTCPMKYKLKYVDGNYEASDAIHLDLGNLLHKILEMKYRSIIDNEEINYKLLKDVYLNGVAEETEKDKGKFIQGVDAIKNKYGTDSFVEVNAKSGLSYDEKLDNFLIYLEEDTFGEDWKPIAVEQHFEFEYEGKVILHGFIDRIDQNSKGELRVVDYKSSNKVFDNKELTTPLQMFIYALACEHIYGKRPVEFMYDMILLGEKQLACTKGYYNRGVKKLNKILDSITESEATGIWKPSATPLCHWCEFSETNPNTAFYMQLCDYYSLWTPTNKTFQKNKEFKPDDIFN